MTDALETLVGADFAAVCERFGAPLGCSQDGAVLRLDYPDANGRPLRSAIELVDGVVAAMRPGIAPSGRPCRFRHLVGGPIEDALGELGRPERIETVGESTRVEFAQCVVTVHEGLVACIAPRQLTASA